MESNKKLVAISYDNKSECKQVAIVKNVNDNEYKKLVNSQIKHENEHECEHRDTKQKLVEHEHKIDKLFGKNVFLAKATYDRFVDRGYINEDKEFDKAFYDYVFNGVDLDLENAPSEFKLIYEKVVE